MIQLSFNKLGERKSIKIVTFHNFEFIHLVLTGVFELPFAS